MKLYYTNMGSIELNRCCPAVIYVIFSVGMLTDFILSRLSIR